MKSRLKFLVIVTALVLVFSFLGIDGSRAEKINKWKNSPGKDKYPNASGIILYDFIGYDFNSDSSINLIEHEVVKLLDKKSFLKFHRIARPLIAPEQTIDVEIARIIKPNGDIKDLKAGKKISREFGFEKNMPLHKNVAILTLDFSEAREGDIIEFKFLHKNKNPLVKGQFWGLSFTNDEIPLLFTELIVRDFRKGAKIHYFTPRIQDGKMKPAISHKNGAKVYTWKLKNRKPIKLEPASPTFRDLVSYVMVSTINSWDNLSAVIYKKFEPYLEVGPEVEANAKELIKTITNDREKIMTLANFIRKKRILDLPFEPDHFEMFKNDDILKCDPIGSGDAQMLFISMLRAAGIKAYPALLSDRRHGKVYEQLPSPFQFNRLITAIQIDNKWKYVDVSVPVTYTMTLKADQQGRRVLILRPEGSKLAWTPISSPEENIEEILVDAELSEDGSLGARMTLIEKGVKRAFWLPYLKMLNNHQQRAMLFGKLVQVIDKNAKLLGTEFSEKEKEDTIQFDITFMTDSYPLISGKYWILKLPTLPARSNNRFLKLPVSRRKLPVMMSNSGIEKKVINLKIPEDIVVKSVPGAVNLSNPVGSLSIECKAEKDRIKYNYLFILKKIEIPVSQYKHLKELYETAEKCSKEVILLEKKEEGKKSDIGKR